jgi:hypothetical protein
MQSSSKNTCCENESAYLLRSLILTSYFFIMWPPE